MLIEIETEREVETKNNNFSLRPPEREKEMNQLKKLLPQRGEEIGRQKTSIMQGMRASHRAL